MSKHCSFTGGENQEEIENHIQDAHQDIECTGNAHVAAAAQHGTRHDVQHEERHEQHKGAKIDGGIWTDLRCRAQPNGKGLADDQAKTGQQQAEQQAHHNGLTHNLPGIFVAFRSQQMGNLHGIASGKCT